MLAPSLTLLLAPVVLTSAASPIGSLTTTTTASHPHRRQSSSSISFNGQAIPLACEGTCATTVPIYNACQSSQNDPVCLTQCDHLEPYADCINCILLNKQDSTPNVTLPAYGSTNQTLHDMYDLCERGGTKPPTTELLPFNLIGTNATSHASTGVANQRTSLGAMAAVVVAGGVGSAWFL